MCYAKNDLCAYIYYKQKNYTYIPYLIYLLKYVNRLTYIKPFYSLADNYF
jgi:hypothetical protein